MNKDRKNRSVQIIVSILFIIPIVTCIFPFILMILTSFTQKTSIDLNFNIGEMELINYISLFKNYEFADMFKNSIIVVICACVLNCFISSLAGYAFAKKQFPLKEGIFWIYMMTLMVPLQAILIPLFDIMNKLHLLNTHLVLFLPIINAFGVFLMRQFMEGIPDELLEVSRIDGANEIRIFFNIVIPIIKPVLVSLTVFTFATVWNDFLWPLVTITDSKMNTVTLGISLLQGNYTTNYGLLMAGSTVAFLPPFIIYIILQKKFIEGIALSGLKG